MTEEMNKYAHRKIQRGKFFSKKQSFYSFYVQEAPVTCCWQVVAKFVEEISETKILEQTSNILEQTSTILGQTSTILGQTSKFLGQKSTFLGQTSTILEQTSKILEQKIPDKIQNSHNIYTIYSMHIKYARQHVMGMGNI